jgi:hypothetical protein
MKQKGRKGTKAQGLTAAHLVGRACEEGQRHGAFPRAGAQLLRHVSQAVSEAAALVDDALCDELALPPLIVPGGPPGGAHARGAEVTIRGPEGVESGVGS